MFQAPQIGTQAVSCPPRIAVWLLVGLTVFASPTMVDAVLPVCVEVELAEENATEYVVVAEERQATSRRSINGGFSKTKFIEWTAGSSSHPSSPAKVVGHRIANGLLAPLRC